MTLLLKVLFHIVGSLLLAAILGLWRKSALRKCENGQLHYGWQLWILGWGCAAFSLLMLSAFYFDKNVFTDLSEFIAVTLLLLFFSAGALFCFAGYFLVKGKFDAQGIVFETPWHGQIKQRWEDLVGHHYREFLECYQLEFRNGAHIRLSTMLRGHNDVLQLINERAIIAWRERKLNMILNAHQIVSLNEEDFDDALLWVDHRSQEDEIIFEVADYLNEPLFAEWHEDKLWLCYATAEADADGNSTANAEPDRKWQLPLTFTRHDRYVALSSLAEVLKDKYSFWLVEGRLGDDTHGLLILSHAVASQLQTEHADWLAETLVPMQLGFDYFNEIKVPYLGHENNNPDFLQQSEAINNSLLQLDKELNSFLENDSEFQAGMTQLRQDLGTEKPSKLKAVLTDPWLWGIVVLWLLYFYLS